MATRNRAASKNTLRIRVGKARYLAWSRIDSEDFNLVSDPMEARIFRYNKIANEWLERMKKRYAIAKLEDISNEFTMEPFGWK